MARRRSTVLGCLLGLFLLFGSVPLFAYSLLTHEQLVDLTWDDSIVPLLLSQYPTLTPAQLDEARAYAYGGCVIQDMGYYPFGDASFSNLTHYIRTGDFIVNLFRNAHSADELAFAIGALSHYVGDSVGHPLATNVAVPIEFPRLRGEYGNVVNYAEGRHEHVQVEFAFDINELVHRRTAPIHYLKHVGLKVPIPQLRMAYYQTYGMYENFSGSRGRRINVRAYRFAVRSFIPRIAVAVSLLHRHDMPPDLQTSEAIEIRKQIDEVSANTEWPKYRRHAGIGSWTLAGLIYILPKWGPLKMTAIKGPTPEAEADYVHSFALSLAAFRRMLVRFTPPDKRRRMPGSAPVDPRPRATSAELAKSVQASRVSEPRPDPLHPLPNRDLDTGTVVKPGGYPLTDITYAALLHLLTRQPALPIPAGIKNDIQSYFSNLDAPFTTKKDPQKWAQVQADLAMLQSIPTSPVPEPYPTYEGDE